MASISRLGRQIEEVIATEALDDLMSVMEALCPVWPLRGTFRDNGKFLL
jgi:hypothetical protein